MTRDLLIGTYTETLPHVHGRADGILTARFDGDRVTDQEVAAVVTNPSWVTATADGSRVYSVIETAPAGGVAAYARDAVGALTPLGEVAVVGAEPAHLVLDPSERFLLVGAYGGGSFSVFALDASGAIGRRTAFVQHEGSGSGLERQAAPHVHQLQFDPRTGDLAVVDLGLGAVLFFAFGDDGTVTALPDATVITGEAGPRHLAFHPSGAHAFLVNELDSTLTLLHRVGDRFEIAGSASARPDEASGESFAAAVRVSEDGGTVFATNRGDDTIAVFAFDVATEALTLLTVVPTQGAAPRDLIVAPGGERILVANQDSSSIAVFSFDSATRSLDVVSLTEVPTPVCLHLL